MIHDDLVRRFEGAPQPSLSPEFSMNLRRRLRGEPSRSGQARWRTWTPWLYWVAAAAGLARYWHPVALTPLQAAILIAVAVAMVLTLRRVARPGPLTRVLRGAFRR